MTRWEDIDFTDGLSFSSAQHAARNVEDRTIAGMPTRSALLAGRRSDKRVIAGSLLLIALTVVLRVVFPLYVIPSASMYPTLRDGDRIVAVRTTDVHRGDVVVFHDDEKWLTDGGDTLVKRVIGVAGDTVEADGMNLYVNGVLVEDTHRRSGSAAAYRNFTMTVPQGQILVLGDNRGESADSSYHGQTVAVSSIIGRGVLIVWPLSDIGVL